MSFYAVHFGDPVTVQTLALPVISGLTDGVAATGTVLTVLVAGAVPDGVIQWRQDGVPIPGATVPDLAVPNAPGAEIAVVVDAVVSATVQVVQTRLVGFGFEGAILNPGDTVTVTEDSMPATAGTVELTRNGVPVQLSAGRYDVVPADLGAFLEARQSDLPSNRSGAIAVQATPVPVLISGPDHAAAAVAGGTLTVDNSDQWQADDAPVTIDARAYRLLIDGIPEASQSSPVLPVPAGSAGQDVQPQLRARTATSGFSAWQNAGSAFTVAPASIWQITVDEALGTFSILSAPASDPPPQIIVNTNGTFDIAA